MGERQGTEKGKQTEREMGNMGGKYKEIKGGEREGGWEKK